MPFEESHAWSLGSSDMLMGRSHGEEGTQNTGMGNQDRNHPQHKLFTFKPLGQSAEGRNNDVNRVWETN